MAEIDRELKELKVKYNVGKPGSTAGVGDLKVCAPCCWYIPSVPIVLLS